MRVKALLLAVSWWWLAATVETNHLRQSQREPVASRPSQQSKG